MARKILQDDEVARRQGRGQEPVAKTGERRRVNRTIEDHCSADSIKCDRLNKGAGLPLATRNRFDQAVASWGPAAKPSEIGLHSHFINENQTLGINVVLAGAPILALARYVRPILLDSTRRLFLKRQPILRSVCQRVFSEHFSPNASRRSSTVASGYRSTCLRNCCCFAGDALGEPAFPGTASGERTSRLLCR